MVDGVVVNPDLGLTLTFPENIAVGAQQHIQTHFNALGSIFSYKGTREIQFTHLGGRD